MSNLDTRYSYRRHLPHIFPASETLFVTFNLHGAIPKHARDSWRQKKQETSISQDKWHEQRQYFQQMERYLHQEHSESPMWLAQEPIAQIVYDAILYRHQQVYLLDCFTIMGNHVHLLYQEHEGATGPLKRKTGQGILHSLKSFTANQANKVLGRSGTFWQHESFDRWVRDKDEWLRTMAYILDNPVKVGLVKQWQDWRWTWIRPELRGLFDTEEP